MTTLDNLKKAAKRWLKALRSGDPDARARYAAAYPTGSAEPTLRDVQHALARERGHESWRTMTSALAVSRPVPVPTGGATHEERVATFLEFACWDNHVSGRGDYRMHAASAARLLAQHPEIAGHSLSTAVVCGDIEEVERILAAEPELANTKGGPRRWEPLLYLTYARVPTPPAGDNALAIARALLDRGADPNVFYQAGDVPYSVLVGLPGEGEQDAPPHPNREALYALLLERGAGPYDQQIVYNTHFHGDVLWWLELTYEHAVRVGRKSDWDDPDWPMFDMGGYGSGARFLLDVALKHHNLRLVEWLLAHGANPNAAPPRDRRLSNRNLVEDARRQGFPEMAALLLRTEPCRSRRCWTIATSFKTRARDSTAWRSWPSSRGIPNI